MTVFILARLPAATRRFLYTAIACIASMACGNVTDAVAAPPDTLASVTVVAPSPTLLLGSSMQLVATARDVRQHPLNGSTDIAYASSDPRSVLVSPNGVATALFDIAGARSSLITVVATRGGVTVRDTVRVRVVSPEPNDYLALLLRTFVVPPSAPSDGQGVAYFRREADRIVQLVTWSDLSTPAIAVHLHGPADASHEGALLVNLQLTEQHAQYGSTSGAIMAADIHAPDGQPALSLDSLNALMSEGLVYIDVHTTSHPAGEIRGNAILRRDAFAASTQLSFPHFQKSQR